jgi:hypothetical protein
MMVVLEVLLLSAEVEEAVVLAELVLLDQLLEMVVQDQHLRLVEHP